MRTLQSIKNELIDFECICGRPRWDHDFGMGGNNETGCESFTPVDAEAFRKLTKKYADNARKAYETYESF
jgi:hypothetical protein